MRVCVCVCVSLSLSVCAAGTSSLGDSLTGELTQTITATTDAPTVLNLAQHSYFNLGGHASGSVLEHTLSLPTASHVLPVDSARIPTGELVPVVGGPFDFTPTGAAARKLGERIVEVDGPGWRSGYDHCFALHRTVDGARPTPSRRERRKALLVSQGKPPPAADEEWWLDAPKPAAILTHPYAPPCALGWF